MKNELVKEKGRAPPPPPPPLVSSWLTSRKRKRGERGTNFPRFPRIPRFRPGPHPFTLQQKKRNTNMV